MADKPQIIHRDTITGEIVSAAYAAQFPDTTVRETRRAGKWRRRAEEAEAKLEAVRALHEPTKWYTDECDHDSPDDAGCDYVETGSGLFHAYPYLLACEECSGGDLGRAVDGPTWWPCPTTIRALGGTGADR